jgi:hypothetical protein
MSSELQAQNGRELALEQFWRMAMQRQATAGRCMALPVPTQFSPLPATPRQRTRKMLPLLYKTRQRVQPSIRHLGIYRWSSVRLAVASSQCLTCRR